MTTRSSRDAPALVAGALLTALLFLLSGCSDAAPAGEEVPGVRAGVTLPAPEDRTAAPTDVAVQVLGADEGEELSRGDFAGEVVVLNFWASWCVPCRREMPALEAVHQQFAGRVAFLGVNHQDRRDDALELIAETGTSYPSVHDPEGDVAVAYELFGMPTTVFITADGLVAGRHTGELTDADLRSALDELTSAT